MPYMLRDGVSTVDTEYGLALLDEDSGEYWNLNPTGALILHTLVDGGTPSQAAGVLAEQYEVDVDEASRDVQALIDDLRTAGLLREGEDTAPRGSWLRGWGSRR